MGTSPRGLEARQRLSVSIEDIYKRRLQRSKDRDIEKPFHIHSQDRSSNCKFPLLKLVLVIIICGTFVSILYSPEVYHDDHLSNSGSRPSFVNRWIWGGEDPRYISHLDINWEEITEVIEKLSDATEYQGIGLLNFNKSENDYWKQLIPDAAHIVLHLDYMEKNVTWDSLYPEWIDEEEESEVPMCPSIPKIEAPRRRLDLIAVKLPCRNEGNWSRDVARLHLQLAAAGLAASAKGYYPVHLLFVSSCFPIPNLFTCKELVVREGNAWLYKPNLDILREKLQLPVGSCELAVPLRVKERIYSGNVHREAYATILHSAHVYVCGAIAAAQSIRMVGSTRDLVILVDETISGYYRSGLEAAGWKVRTIQRIRNPKAEKDAYNEWNYSKFRLWQLTDYDKIIFIDADLLILRNIDFLFGMPEISATGNNGTLFNSGVMVIEPSNCTFQLLMDHINEIESYNGGDQGYLNEIFTWWHRIPKHMNFLKNFWVGGSIPSHLKEGTSRNLGAVVKEGYRTGFQNFVPSDKQTVVRDFKRFIRMEQEQEQEQEQQQHSGYSTKGDNYGGELWAEVISTEPRASILHNLLSKDECHHLINLAKPHLERSTMIDFVTNVRQVDPSRTSTQATLARGQDKIVSDIEKRVADFTSIPVEHGEGLRILHYEVGGKFEPHYDYFDDRVYENGGPRMITIIMYLSDVEEGGETYFPFAKGGKVSAKPKMGDALIFWSMKPDGTLDLISIHGGSPVVKGEKWVCTKSLHVNEYMC